MIFLDVLIQRDAEPCMFSPEARTVHFHLRCFTPPRHSNKNTPAVNTLSPSSSSVSVALCSHCSSRVELHNFFVYPASCCPVGCKVSLVLVVCTHTHTVTHTQPHKCVRRPSVYYLVSASSASSPPAPPLSLDSSAAVLSQASQPRGDG